MSDHSPSVCWLGTGRYTYPLDDTQTKKWATLAELGIDMRVIGFSTDMRFRHFAQSAHFYLLPELPTAVLRYLELFLLAPWLLLWLALRYNVQAIISRSPIDGAIGAFVKLALRLLGRRVALVVESHGDFEISSFQQRQLSGAKIYSAVLNVCARFALRHADRLRSVSAMTRRQLEAYAPTTPMHQFMGWLDSRAFTETPRAVPLSKSQNVVYAGVLIPRKGVHILIEAFAQIAVQFPETLLYLVGDARINEAYARQLKAEVERFGLRSRVVFVGAVSQQALATYLGRARVLVLPSFSEGLGRVLVEAMLCGTPAIGSAVDGIPDVVQDGITGYLVPPGDVDALARRIAEVLGDPEIEAMGMRARAFAETFFSPEAYVEGYRHLLDEALSGTRHDRQPAAV